jgi:hypothetical protein
MTEYRAGACNINRTERRKRLVAGAAGFTNSAILAAVLFFFPQFTLLYAAIFLLNLMGFLGLIQYRNRFCAGLALKKKFHVGDEAGEVSSPEKVSRDRQKALLMIAESVIASALLTAGIYLALANF